MIQCNTLRRFCEEKGYIPEGAYFRALITKSKDGKPIDWERELRQAAYDGRIDDFEYILEWLQCDKPVDINAKGQQSGKQHYIMQLSVHTYMLSII